ncbi:radical SAM family heme chaperone HemW [Selenihalanaerobacter shriftii]|uniref:Heme chaperone HemW n=1 Tax=Selenihalanaerobacter shriftii TaxID=142842 RepID=A0A1T4Q008_9FIRM|nr:radical SAM family heme chaperone HemW [Selenihalanaerobacter shriftii]SJZ96558.1 oxygen-independent coproporphyrinogen-3 oxidase [Selenihalanaerobacter shriftii]
MKKIGLYIHIPFCIRKCYYCDFNSRTWESQLANEFLTALFEEIKMIANKYKYPTLKSVFIGGGTPTCLDGDALLDLLLLLKEEFKVESDSEISIEANPGTLSKNKLSLLKEGGINRLSFGVQSFNNQTLRELGRIHTAKQAIDNYYLARELGFENINLDLIFALPGQKVVEWEATLRQSLKLHPNHLSTYNLKIEPGTKFARDVDNGLLEPVSEEIDLEMYQLTMDFLTENGYKHYEISNFARSGYESEHNRIYWRNEPYLALGPGAHFYDGDVRGSNVTSISEYINTVNSGELPIKEVNQLTREDKIVESMILGLRLREGISLSRFEDRFGESLDKVYGQEIKKLEKENYIRVTSKRITLTRRGLVLANDVLAEFILG